MKDYEELFHIFFVASPTKILFFHFSFAFFHNLASFWFSGHAVKKKLLETKLLCFFFPPSVRKEGLSGKDSLQLLMFSEICLWF